MIIIIIIIIMIINVLDWKGLGTVIDVVQGLEWLASQHVKRVSATIVQDQT
jgi:hypothetical protein